MSLKIPPREARTQPYHANRRESTSKRPLVHSEDDDDAPAPPITQRTKRARMADSDPLSPVSSDDDDDMEVDVDTFEDDDPSALHEVRENTSKKRKKSAATKKKQVVYSDEDSTHMERDSEEDDLSDSAPLADLSDDDFELDPLPKGSAAKAKVKGKAGKAKLGQLKGAQAKGSKGKEKDKDISMKDERKTTVPSATSRGSSAAAQSQPSDLFSNDDPALSSAVDVLPDTLQSAKDALSQPIPKKRKLPPIKKTKGASGATGTCTPTAATQKPAAPPVQELAKPSLPTSEQRKQALTGVRDVDLGDSKVYAELFKGAGANMPRSGLKNAEERRKELDKMRDEARARRAEEAKFTFDLQSQADKIARFEQRLRAENSTVLHPNFLAAKFRDEWELERRHRRATPKEEGEA